MSNQGPEPLVLFLSLLLYLGFELSFRSMDFPADITLRKTRMKFWIERSRLLCYSVIKVLLSCESFYILSHRLLFVKNFFKEFLTSFLKFFFLLILSNLAFCSFASCNFYILSHIFYLVKNFFIYLKNFFRLSFKLMCSHVRRMLSYHRVSLPSRVFSNFFNLFAVAKADVLRRIKNLRLHPQITWSLNSNLPQARETLPKREETLYLWLYHCGLNVRLTARIQSSL